MLTIQHLTVGKRIHVNPFFLREYKLRGLAIWCNKYGANRFKEVCYESGGIVVGEGPNTSCVAVLFRTGVHVKICDVLLEHILSANTKPMAPQKGQRVFIRQHNKLEFEPLEFGWIRSFIPDNETDDPQTSVMIESDDGISQRSVTIGKDVVVVD